MKEMVFSEKDCKTTFSLNDRNFEFKIQKPMICPICNAFEDGVRLNSDLLRTEEGKYYGVVHYKCTHCSKTYLVIYNIDRTARQGTFGAFFPTTSVIYENETLAHISPMFIDSYNQAIRAEAAGDVELAAIGYRQALECLIKDYAINELNVTKDIVVKKDLFTAIGEYLGHPDLVATADVVRILGNDYAHYERKYPEHDFALLKNYMEIFIKLIETNIMIAHTPVSR